MLLSQLIFSSTIPTSTIIVLIHILYCIVVYQSDLEHLCGFYAIQNKLLLLLVLLLFNFTSNFPSVYD